MKSSPFVLNAYRLLSLTLVILKEARFQLLIGWARFRKWFRCLPFCGKLGMAVPRAAQLSSDELKAYLLNSLQGRGVLDSLKVNFDIGIE